MTAQLPLAQHLRFRSSDLDETREHVARVFCDHRLSLAAGERHLDARQHVARLGDVTLSYLDYGGAVEIEPGPLDSFYLVQIPLAGRAGIRCGAEEIVSDPTLASVPDPDAALSMRWESGCPHLIVRFERHAVERRVAELLGRPLTAPVVFSLGLDLRGEAGERWRTALSEALAQAEHGQGLGTPPLEDELVALLLLSHRSTYSRALATGAAQPGPRAVRRAVAFIDEHVSEPLSVADIAAAAGVSIRSLQLGFRRVVGRSPMRYLRDLRLDRVRAELRAGHGPVTDVAVRWGFSHLGRFAAEYRARFGETPSATLRLHGGAAPR